MSALLLAFLQGGFDPDVKPLPMAESAPMAVAPLLLWSRPLPGPPPASASRSEPAPPVLRDGKIYIGYSGVSALLILSRGDGTLLRSLPTAGPVASAPVFADGKIYVADMAGYVSCFLEDSYEQLWSRHAGAPILSSVVVDGELLYVSTVDDIVYKLDRRNGTTIALYTHRVDTNRAAKLSLYGAPSVTLAGSEVLAGFSDGMIVGIGKDDWAEHWSLPVGEGSWPDIIAPLLWTPDIMVAGGFSGPLLGLDAGTHLVRWRQDFGSASTMTHQGDQLYHGGTDGILRKIDLRTGDIAWEWQADIPGLSFNLNLTGQTTQATERVTSGTMGTPQICPLGVLVSNSDGSLYLLNPESGKLIWSLDPNVLLGGILGKPAIDGSEIYALSNAGILYAMRGRGSSKTTAELDPWVSPFR